MTHHLTPSATVLRLAPVGSGGPATALGTARLVDPWAAVGPAALLDEDPARLAVLAEGDAGPTAVGVLGVHPLGNGRAALLEVAEALPAPELDPADLEALAADADAPEEARVYARLAVDAAGMSLERGVRPGPMPRANILCILLPHLKICRAQKRR